MDKKDPAIHRCIQCLYQLALIGMYDIRKRLSHLTSSPAFTSDSKTPDSDVPFFLLHMADQTA